MLAGYLRCDENSFTNSLDCLSDSVFRTINLCRIDEVRTELNTTMQRRDAAFVIPSAQPYLGYSIIGGTECLSFHA